MSYRPGDTSAATQDQPFTFAATHGKLSALYEAQRQPLQRFSTTEETEITLNM